jgi:hypothetical protein
MHTQDPRCELRRRGTAPEGPASRSRTTLQVEKPLQDWRLNRSGPKWINGGKTSARSPPLAASSQTSPPPIRKQSSPSPSFAVPALA